MGVTYQAHRRRMRPLPHDIGRHDVARGMRVGPDGPDGMRTIRRGMRIKRSVVVPLLVEAAAYDGRLRRASEKVTMGGR